MPNEADIYFDLNAPVITDPCNVLVELSTSITEEIKDGIGVFPQPTTGPVFLWQDGSWNGARYDLYDIRGARLAAGVINAPLLSLDLSGQSAGVYLLHVQRGAKTVALRLFRE